MDISNNLIDKLTKLGINPESLSKNEKKYLSQINNVFEKYKTTNEELITQLNKNKFNKMIVSKKVDCTRQTLYKNPTLSLFMEYCLSEAEKIQLATPNDCVQKDKYQHLKDENTKLLINIVKDAQKDAEIERLTKELKEKEKRIKKLIERIESQGEELRRLKTPQKSNMHNWS